MLTAHAGALAQLPAKSPFVAPAISVNATAPAETQLRLLGILTVGQRTLFRLHDPARNFGVWLAVGERTGEFMVKAYDPVADTITVEYQGRSHTLTLRTGKVLDGGAIQPEGTDLVPPRNIRNGVRNQSIPLDEIKPYMNTEWYKDFVRQYGPPVYRPPQ